MFIWARTTFFRSALRITFYFHQFSFPFKNEYFVPCATYKQTYSERMSLKSIRFQVDSKMSIFSSQPEGQEVVNAKYLCCYCSCHCFRCCCRHQQLGRTQSQKTSGLTTPYRTYSNLSLDHLQVNLSCLFVTILEQNQINRDIISSLKGKILLKFNRMCKPYVCTSTRQK